MPLVDGVWEYTETDVIAPTFSEYMNLGTDSARTRIQAAAATAAAASGAVAATLSNAQVAATLASGWVVVAGNQHSPRIRRVGNMCFLVGAIQRDGTAGAATNLLTVPAAVRPTAAGTRMIGAAALSTGGVAELLLTTGTISIAAGYGTGAIASGTVVPLHCMWVID